MSEPKPAYVVAVVGDASVMPADELASLLDLLVNRHTQCRSIVLLSVDKSPAGEWARDREYSRWSIGNRENATKEDCHIVSLADAVVVLGDPANWQFLIDLCGRAGTPVRVFRKRLKIPDAPQPAWDVAE